MLNNEVSAALERWESQREMTLEMARVIEKNFDRLMELELRQVDDLLADDKPEAAFTRLTSLTSFLHAVISKLPSAIKRLEKWVNKIKSTLNALAKKLGANGFSIGLLYQWAYQLICHFDYFLSYMDSPRFASGIFS